MNTEFNFKLFVAGNEPNSSLARKHIHTICETYLEGNYQFEEIDVLNNFQAAIDHGIFVTPTLLIKTPLFESTIVGNLKDTHKVLQTLGVHEKQVT
ncbi:MAG: circadian clock protein KaiB [Desulfobacterales bacterium]|nr:circadian clock protein KaiB [Desulfobacterales bacterium]